MPRFREEVINVELAHILASRGLEANAETISRGNLPDVLISLDGIRLIIEGRTSTASQSLLRDAERRVSSGLADLSMAIVYPPKLKEADSHADLCANLEGLTYNGVIFFVAAEGIRTQTFEAETIDGLVRTINSVFGLRIQNDVVRRKVAEVQKTLDAVVNEALGENLFFKSSAVIDRLQSALGIDHGA